LLPYFVGYLAFIVEIEARVKLDYTFPLVSFKAIVPKLVDPDPTVLNGGNKVKPLASRIDKRQVIRSLSVPRIYSNASAILLISPFYLITQRPFYDLGTIEIPKTYVNRRAIPYIPQISGTVSGQL